MPKDLICCNISIAAEGSAITVLSVISSFKASGGRASSCSKFLMSSTSFGCRNCLADRLTLIDRWRWAIEPALHSLICWQAFRKFHQPSSRIRQHLFRLFVGRGAQSNSDAHRSENLFPTQNEWRGQGLHHAVRGAFGIARIFNIVEQDCKFVSP